MVERNDPLRELVEKTETARRLEVEAQEQKAREVREAQIKLEQEFSDQEQAYQLLTSEPKILDPLISRMALFRKIFPGTLLTASRPSIGEAVVVPANLRLWVPFCHCHGMTYESLEFLLNPQGRIQVIDAFRRYVPPRVGRYGHPQPKWLRRVISPKEGILIDDFPEVVSNYLAQFAQEIQGNNFPRKYVEVRPLTDTDAEARDRDLRAVFIPSTRQTESEEEYKEYVRSFARIGREPTRDRDKTILYKIYRAPFSHIESTSDTREQAGDKLLYPSIKTMREKTTG